MTPEEKLEQVLATHPPGISSVRELFRLAHLWKFHKLLCPSMAAREEANFHMNHYLPQYVKDYLDNFSLEDVCPTSSKTGVAKPR